MVDDDLFFNVFNVLMRAIFPHHLYGFSGFNINEILYQFDIVATMTYFILSKLSFIFEAIFK